MLRYSLVLLAGLAASAPASAAWTAGLFEESTKDFGAVPRGPTLSHLFFFTNNTGKKIHIAGVRVSCGCVSASAVQHDVAPGETSAIRAYMDTRRFQGHKQVTIYVSMDQPSWEEVSLVVRANGRDDLYVTPDSFTLGKVKHGAAPKATVNVTMYGGSLYQIASAESESSFVKPTLKEIRRNGSEVTYEVTVNLNPDTPSGNWFSEIWLKTNNPSMPKIRVPLSVEVAAAPAEPAKTDDKSKNDKVAVTPEKKKS